MYWESVNRRTGAFLPEASSPAITAINSMRLFVVFRKPFASVLCAPFRWITTP